MCKILLQRFSREAGLNLFFQIYIFRVQLTESHRKLGISEAKTIAATFTRPLVLIYDNVLVKGSFLAFINSVFEFANSAIPIIVISSVAFSGFAFLIFFSWDYIIAGQWLLLFGRGVANARNLTLEKKQQKLLFNMLIGYRLERYLYSILISCLCREKSSLQPHGLCQKLGTYGLSLCAEMFDVPQLNSLGTLIFWGA